MPSKYAEKLQSTINGSGLMIADSVLNAIMKKAHETGKNENWDKAREVWAEAGKLKVSDLRIVAGEHEFPMAEILQAVENHYVEAFDRVVAATVKEVAFEAQLDSVRDVLDNLSSRVNDLKDDLNGEVGRKIEKVLGPNAFWSESSGTC